MVSVIIPVYNTELYLGTCVKSILEQTYLDLEVVIVDDGSKENCGRECDKFAKDDKRVKVIHKTNGGLASARNAGIEAASGKYICFVDSDDWVDKKYVENLVDCIEKTNAKLAVSEVSIDFVNDGFEQKIKFDANISSESVSNGLGYMMQTESFNYSCNKLYLKNIIDIYQLRFNRGDEPAEDFFFNSKYISYISCIAFSKQTPYHYVRRDTEMMTNKYIPNLYTVSKRANTVLKNMYLDYNIMQGDLKSNFLETYVYRMFSCVPNLFRRESVENKWQRIDIFNDMINDSELNHYLQDVKTSDVHLKLYRRLIKMKSARMMEIIYSVLFWIRNNMTILYYFIRKIIRKRKISVK